MGKAPRELRRARAPAERLTAELIRLRHPRPVSHAPTRARELPRERLQTWLCEFVGGLERRGVDLWVFAYGSLLWNDELPASERRLALVHGLHRRFCLWQWSHRGTVTRPCLMLALDRGGSCRGMAYRINGPNLAGKLHDVWYRELRGDGYRPCWIRARTPEGPVQALAFAINRGGERYAGRLPDAVVADYIAHACGRDGACAEYLLRTVQALERTGVRDASLARLAGLVAQRLKA